MRAGESRPFFGSESAAKRCASYIETYFHVKCRILGFKDGWQVVPPNTLGLTRSDAVENFIVAYKHGLEDSRTFT